MSQEQEPTILHYRALAKDCGLHGALQAAARDVDALREELRQRYDGISVLAFFSFVLGFGVGALLMWVSR